MTEIVRQSGWDRVTTPGDVMPARRLAAVAGLLSLYLAGYFAATRIAVLRGPDALVQTALPLDRLIPYLPESWPLYWVAYPFVIGGGGLVLLRLPERGFRRAVAAIGGMTLLGTLIQACFPAQAPWPSHPALSQRLFHESALILPYATLPSMHVAYCVVIAGLVRHLLPGRLTTVWSLTLVLAVAASTVLLREHVLLDAVTGLALGQATLWWWRKGAS